MKKFFFAAFTILGIIVFLETCDNNGNKPTYDADKAAEYERNQKNKDGALLDNAYKDTEKKATKDIAIDQKEKVAKVEEVKAVVPSKIKYPSDLVINIDELLFLLNQKSDSVYVVNFWATWCKPCVEELPYFEAFTAQHKNDKIKVILCSLDFPKKVESQLLPFLKKNKLKSEVVVLLDGKFNNWINKVSKKWDGAIPVTYIYKGNKEHFINSSIESSKELEDAINLL